ncbi:hypothetical protein ACFLU6_03925 [Acidobacteriota bacterium]
MKRMKSFLRIVDLHMVVVTGLCILATTAAVKLDFASEMPTTLISFAIIFPVVFAINASYRRRETALGLFGDIKGHSMALFYAHRDWLDDKKSGLLADSRNGILELFESLRQYLSSGQTDPTKDMDVVYDRISDLSAFHEKLRTAGIPTGEMSRMNQYLKNIVTGFEKMRNFKHYRTPITLRSFNRVFLNLFPILFAPYFAHLIDLENPKSFIVGYGIGILYSVVLVGLDNIQEDLENPYDAIGEDDLRLDVKGIYAPLMEEHS